MTTLRNLLAQLSRRDFPHLRRRMKMAGAYQRVFTSPEGQIVLRDLLQTGGVLAIAFEPGDSGATHFNDGKRALALHILDRLRWSEGELMQLGQEITYDELIEREQQEAA